MIVDEENVYDEVVNSELRSSTKATVLHALKALEEKEDDDCENDEMVINEER